MRFSKSKIVSIFVLAVILSATVAESRRPSWKKSKNRNGTPLDKCPNSKMVSCGAKIKKIVLQCSSDENAMECVNSMLVDTPCYPCIDKVLPGFTDIETYEHDNKNLKDIYNEAKDKMMKEEEKEINDVIHSYATCGKKEMFMCRKKVNRVGGQCKGKGGSQGTLNCMKENLKDDQCHVCICTIKPELCDQSEVQEEEEKEEENDDETFSFLGGLSKKFAKLEQIRQKAGGDPDSNIQERLEQLQKMDPTGMFGALGSVMNSGIFKKVEKIADKMEGGEKGQRKKANQREQTEDDEDDEPELGDLQGLMQSLMKDPRKTHNLLQQLQINEKDLESDEDYDNIQQKITQRIMEHPELLKSLMEENLDDERLGNLLQDDIDNNDEDTLSGSEDTDDEDSTDSEDEQENPLDQEDSPFDKECKDPQQKELCKWKILKVLPSCIDTETKPCLDSLLHSHPCKSCICTIVPDSC